MKEECAKKYLDTKTQFKDSFDKRSFELGFSICRRKQVCRKKLIVRIYQREGKETNESARRIP